MTSPRPLRVALTGGIASGKSYVLAGFAAHGLPTIDADRLARGVVAPGSPGLAEVVARFGPAVLAPDGALDRARLAREIFEREPARRDLERIVHPRVYAAIAEWFQALARAEEPIGIADVPLLFESGRQNDFHRVVVAACPAAVQIERLMARDGLPRGEAERRLAAQWPTDRKAARADFVIRTDGSFAETDAQIAGVVEALGVGGRRQSKG